MANAYNSKSAFRCGSGENQRQTTPTTTKTQMLVVLQYLNHVNATPHMILCKDNYFILRWFSICPLLCCIVFATTSFWGKIYEWFLFKKLVSMGRKNWSKIDNKKNNVGKCRAHICKIRWGKWIKLLLPVAMYVYSYVSVYVCNMMAKLRISATYRLCRKILLKINLLVSFN